MYVFMYLLVAPLLGDFWDGKEKSGERAWAMTGQDSLLTVKVKFPVPVHT